jgi:hypothetical protein
MLRREERAGEVAQMIELLPSNYAALSSDPSTTRKVCICVDGERQKVVS